MQRAARLAVPTFFLFLIPCGASSEDVTPATGIENARNLPADDKVAFIIGQDSTTLAEFESSVLDSEDQADFPTPSGVTLYTAILPASLHPNTAPEDATL